MSLQHGLRYNADPAIKKFQNNKLWNQIPGFTFDIGLFTGGIQNLGCWRDTANRAIQPLEGRHHLLRDAYGTRSGAFDKCVRATKDFGYTVFALQHGGWCASAPDAESTYRKYGRSNACAGDGEGGPWGNQVYKLPPGEFKFAKKIFQRAITPGCIKICKAQRVERARKYS